MFRGSRTLRNHRLHLPASSPWPCNSQVGPCGRCRGSDQAAVDKGFNTRFRADRRGRLTSWGRRRSATPRPGIWSSAHPAAGATCRLADQVRSIPSRWTRIPDAKGPCANRNPRLMPQPAPEHFASTVNDMNPKRDEAPPPRRTDASALPKTPASCARQ